MWFWTVESNVDPINWCVIRMLSPIVSVIKNHESLTLKVSNCAFFFHIYIRIESRRSCLKVTFCSPFFDLNSSDHEVLANFALVLKTRRLTCHCISSVLISISMARFLETAAVQESYSVDHMIQDNERWY